MKDAFYFSHDSNAKDDPKCTWLIEQLGLEGYGIYWILLETLREQPSYSYPIVLLPSLARKYNTTHEKVKAVVMSYNLFTVTEDQIFFSDSFTKRMSVIDRKREVNREIANRRWNKNNSALALPTHMPTHCDNECDGNASKGKESKVKESKEKESKEDVKREKQKRFSAPSKEDIISFFISDKGINTEDVLYFAERFMNFYESKNWMVGKNKMTNWKTAAVRSLDWEDKRGHSSAKPAGKFGYNNINEEELLKSAASWK